MSVGERRALLGLLGLLNFAAVYATVVVAPVLTQIAAEFEVSTGTAGLLVAAYGAPGVIVSLATGPFSDRHGRKRFLVIGTLAMGFFTLASAFATTFVALIALRTAGGIGAALIFPNSTALVGDSFSYRDRGRAMSTVIAFNTMASVIGIPTAGIVAEATSWRLSVGFVGALSMVAGLLLLVTLRPVAVDAVETRFFELYRSVLRNSSAVAAAASSFLGTLFWITWSTYIVAFFELVYGLSRGTASVVALTLGIGALIGSQVGGRLGERIGQKPIVAGAIVASACVLLVLTNLHVPLGVAAALNLVVSALIGARFNANQTLMTEQMPAARGTLLALASSTIGLAIVAGAWIGGQLIDNYGFNAVGIFCFIAAIGCAVVVTLFVREGAVKVSAAA